MPHHFLSRLRHAAAADPAPTPDLAPAAPSDDPTAADALRERIEAVRTTIDLLETDLVMMIRDVNRSADAARSGIQASSASLDSITQRSVVLETKIDPALIGGVVAQVGSHMYDGSLRSQLAELGRALSR